ncbi:hypothetical protein SALBM311S_09754 [Streptomyces alboniger]
MERHVAIVALVLGAVLPYIAVVIANAGRENAPSLPSTFVTVPTRPMITPPSTDEGFAESGVGPRAEDVKADSGQGVRNEPRDPA